MTRREQLYPEIRRLREDEGLMWREIGERLGLARATVHDYYADPTGEGARARKAKTNGACVDCGAATASDGSVVPERCRKCAEVERGTLEARRRLSAANSGSKRWSDDELVRALRAAAHQGPLTKQGYDRACARAPRGSMPCAATIVNRFGRWANALLAAGLQGRGPNQTSHATTRAACLLAIRDCMADVGAPPTYRQYVEWAMRVGAPCGTLVRLRCGGWMPAVDAVLAPEDELVAA